jgi:UDP:flavonoid glycosyltransferase YjiC (YdhE family)
MAQALASGTPQLVMPLAHDQFDNAVRVRRLGAGDYILPRDFKGAAVADSLLRLSTNRETAEAVKKYAALLTTVTPLETTCNLLESCRALAA